MGALPQEAAMGLLFLLLLLPLLRGGSMQELRGYKLDVQRPVLAQEGLCVFVPCAFSVGWSTGSPHSMYLYWFREGDSELYDAPVATTDPSRAVRPETRGRFRLLGDPKTRNCSLAVSPVRKADTGSYYLWVEQERERYSFRNTKLYLYVSASLQELQGYKLDVQCLVSAQEGLCVFVPCAFSVGWSPQSTNELHLHWFCEGNDELHDAPVATTDLLRGAKLETQGRFHLLGDPKTRNCSLAVSPARKADAGTYHLLVEQGGERYSFRNPKLYLHVSALTEKPDIYFREPLRSGRPETLTCSLRTDCERDGLFTVSWAGDALAPLGPERLRSSRLTLTPRPKDHGTSLTCRVTLPGAGVSTERTVWLNVTYPPQKVTASISHSNGSAFRTLGHASSMAVPEGQALWLLCEADSNPPAKMSWFRGPPAPNANPIAISTTLELPAMGTPGAGELSCLAQHPLGSRLMSFCLCVQKGLQRSPGVCRCETEEQRGSWPLVFTLIRGALMGAGFVLTYGLTWIYYTRCKDAPAPGPRGPGEPPS